jgi:hypothetical protein
MAGAATGAGKRKRAKPGAKGGGRFYHIEVRPRGEFVLFRMQDVGGRGGIERLAGRRPSGSWDTVKWLIGKHHAHVENGRLVADTAEARKVIGMLGSAPRHVLGDRFRAKPRANIPAGAAPRAARQHQEGAGRARGAPPR